MENNKRMFTSLINVLNETEKKLLDINNESERTSYILMKDQCKSSSNMKIIVDSLVTKTVKGKSCDADIALPDINSYHSHNGNQEYLNLMSAEIYLEETKKLLRTDLKCDSLHKYFKDFLELLGDILFSSCQINNYKLKLPSGISVKDLLEVKDLYISIWELMYSLTEHNVGKPRPTSRQSALDDQRVGIKINELQNCLHRCLDEMFKVKLGIEHYLKSNIIEMEFADTRTGLKKTHCEDFPIESENNIIKLNDINTADIKRTNRLLTSGCCVEASLEKRICSPPSTLFSFGSEHAEETDSQPYLFPVKKETWSDWYDSKAMEETYGDFIMQSVIYPPEILFLDPTSIFLHSKIGSPQSHTPPKIYSVDSLHDERTNTGFRKNVSDHEERNVAAQSEISSTMEMNCRDKKDVRNPVTNEYPEEDLFGRKFNLTKDISESLELKEKISSLFNTMRSNEVEDIENIFDATPLRIESSDISFIRHQNNKTFARQNSWSITRNKQNKEFICTSKDIGCKNKTLINDDKNTRKQHDKPNKHLYDSYRYNDGKEYINHAPSNLDEVIYDKKSLIELFRTRELNKDSHSGSYPTEESKFCMWPVAAEYIQVSKERRQNRCNTLLSNNSTCISDNSEESYFSLHLNKRYDQNQVYDNDLIVLENSKGFKNGGNSSYSLNQSLVVIDIDQAKSKEKGKIEYKYNKKLKSFPTKPSNKRDNIKARKGNWEKGKVCNMAVQYADCRDSFVVKKKHFEQEKMDFFKFNQNCNNDNWNSFISIFTSKVGPSTRVNHHRMFGKVLTNVGPDPLQRNDLMTNIHTLTSSGGPFRLFDLNGYPLTDSAGNVLKDPYGKSVVHLDSTGVPKNDVKVFDAAGNSLKDVNFDPTQKPKSNSIIIKLTDNFKRPLHLFDKYGRPLTDSFGKLLVNIHGRPLLRFDNFGRPNSDYRGGPLYTDNGFRWSYKTGESISKDKLNDEKTMDNHLMEDSCEPITLEETCPGWEVGALKNNSLDPKCEVAPTLNNTNSDIWLQVENVLQHFPKKKQTNKNSSQTSVIINNVTISQNPVEKELLKSIIYHNNIVQEDLKHKKNIDLYYPDDNLNQYQLTLEEKSVEEKTNFDKCKNCVTKTTLIQNKPVTDYLQFPFYKFQGLEKKCMKDNKTLIGNTFMDSKPFFNNLFLKNSHSQCFNHNYLYEKYLGHKKDDKCLNGEDYFGKLTQLSESDPLTKIGNVNISTLNLTNSLKKPPSNVVSKNYQYLNNLCNEILKYQIDYHKKGMSAIPTSLTSKPKTWTDTSFTEFLSSSDSKYTTETTTYKETPILSTDLSRKKSAGKRMTEKHVNCKIPNTIEYNSKNQNKLNFYRSNQDKCCKCVFRNKENVELGFGPTDIKSSSELNEKCQCDTSESTSLKPQLSINNKEDNNLKSKVDGKVMKEFKNRIVQPNTGKLIPDCDNHKGRTNGYKSQKPERDTTEKYNKTVKSVCCLEEEKHHKIKYRGKYIDSPFRFPSEDQESSTITLEQNFDEQSTQRKIDLYSELNSNQEVRIGIRDNGCKHNMSMDKITENKFEEGRHCNEPRHQHLLEKASRGCRSNHGVINGNTCSRADKQKPFNRKDFSTIKNRTPSIRECSLVSFLGSPVKYVLNKIENKRLSKPQEDKNTLNQNLIEKTGNDVKIQKANRIKDHNQRDKYLHDAKIQALYNSSHKNDTKLKGKHLHTNRTTVKDSPKHGGNLLAYKSKSCTGFFNQNEVAAMSYSGNENDFQEQKHWEYLSKSKVDIRKCSSFCNCLNQNHCNNNYPICHTQTLEYQTSKQKDKTAAFKIKNTRQKFASPLHSTGKLTKTTNEQKKYSTGRHFKPPRNGTKNMSLFKKFVSHNK
uniref:Uncharacterized protein n=1 Tax=Graphocephala atropunctata TaxID=36148 RepID=A0A1B6LAU0_9HEMI